MAMGFDRDSGKRVSGHGLACMFAAACLAWLLVGPGGAWVREAAGRSGWLLVAWLAWTGWIALRRTAPARLRFSLRRLAGILLSYACFVSAEYLSGWASRPRIGSFPAHWLRLSPPALWVALALAALGVGIAVPLWLGWSWSEILKSLSGLQKWIAPSPSEAPEAQRAPSDGPVLHVREPSNDAPAPLPGSSRAWSLPRGARRTSAEGVSRPQNGSASAGPGVAAGRESERPTSGARQPEVIDLPWVLGNLEKRYRGKWPLSGAPGTKSKSDETPPVMMDIEEIRQRMKTIYRTRMADSARRPAADPRREMASRTFAPADKPQERQVAPAGPTAAKTPAGSASSEGRPAGDARGGPDERPRSGVPEGITPLAKVWTPALPAAQSEPKIQAGGLMTPPLGAPGDVRADAGLHGMSRIDDADAAFAAVNQRTPDARPYGLQRPEEPAEEDGHDSHAVLPPSAVECKPQAPVGQVPLPTQGGENRLFRSGFRSDPCLPTLSLLHPADPAFEPMSPDDLLEGGILIEEKLAEFRVKVNVLDACAGPVITRYEVQPAVGVRGGQVVSLMKDLARALGVAAIRVVETIPGKTCMGLELPNSRRQMIRLSEVLSSEVFQAHASKLAMVLGKDITGAPVVADLGRAPHMLVAGTTGSGKSVGVNAMILSLLYRATPEDVRFLMVDPKMLELSIYDGIPHLLAPVVTDMKLAANALNWCVGEMERRYRLMSALGVRNLAGYNQKVREAMTGRGAPAGPFDIALDANAPLSPLPYVVVVVDEFADLMMVAGKKIEELIARLAQKARAAGIHLILATQRPSVDVITGLIKANIPTRVAFQVSSKVDSRTILDQMGAECLLGQGDMLYLPPGTGYPQRVHGAFVADEEVHAIAEYLKQFGEPDYVEGVLSGTADAEEAKPGADRLGDFSDPLYDEAVAFVISSRRASISSVQRHLRIGYNRSARLIEQMEAAGVVSSMESNGNRTVLVPALPE